MEKRPLTDWLPVSREEMEARGWEEVDVIIVSGDAYVDHPGFGHAVIARILENEGLRVAILPQPNWRDDLRDFRKLGKPRLFFGVTAGCMDSMVNHYTAMKRRRSTDAYTPGGKAGFRPDYATVVYSRILKQLFPDVPVIIGGVEASLRRATHYDYWSNSLKPGILEESGADLLVYGMGETAIRLAARHLQEEKPLEGLQSLPQLAFLAATPANDTRWEQAELPSHGNCMRSKKAFGEHFRIMEENSNMLVQKRLVQKTGKQWLVINPPFPAPGEEEADLPYGLPYTRLPHPRYQKRGDIPAWEMIRFSVNIHRGCFGGCSFCTISAHQGKFISSRSESSILAEVKKISAMSQFRGHISDLGGPSANMYRMKGMREKPCLACKKPSCIFPDICKNLSIDHGPLLNLYRRVSDMPGVKKVSIGSGIRYDLLVNRSPEEDRKNHLSAYLKQFITRHVSGRLKVAPEHTSAAVLNIMRKPAFHHFYALYRLFGKYSSEAGLNQELIPYFISSHPGCKLADMAELAAETKKMGFRLEQVQDFTPTPMTLSSVMYYCGFDPYTGKVVFSANSMDEKAAQNRFFFWYKSDNRKWIAEKLHQMGRKDLLDRMSRK
jgi:uncharacterized radical SAM protein YgiQ